MTKAEKVEAIDVEKEKLIRAVMPIGACTLPRVTRNILFTLESERTESLFRDSNTLIGSRI